MKILDDRSALSTQPSGLDPTFDTDGKVTTKFGGDDTGMAIQPDGKIVMVGGSTSDFVLAALQHERQSGHDVRHERNR